MAMLQWNWTSFITIKFYLNSIQTIAQNCMPSSVVAKIFSYPLVNCFHIIQDHNLLVLLMTWSLWFGLFSWKYFFFWSECVIVIIWLHLAFGIMAKTEIIMSSNIFIRMEQTIIWCGQVMNLIFQFHREISWKLTNALMKRPPITFDRDKSRRGFKWRVKMLIKPDKSKNPFHRSKKWIKATFATTFGSEKLLNDLKWKGSSGHRVRSTCFDID